MSNDNDDRRAITDALRHAQAPLFPNLDEVQKSLREKAAANVAHTPRQQGPWIVCTSCQNHHTLTWVGALKSLVGIDEKGGYILVDRKF